METDFLNRHLIPRLSTENLYRLTLFICR